LLQKDLPGNHTTDLAASALALTPLGTYTAEGTGKLEAQGFPHYSQGTVRAG